MELYAEYVKELRGDEVIQTPQGFAVYRVLNVNGVKSLYIVDMYVKPEFRRLNEGSEMADMMTEIARDYGCTELCATVVLSTKNPTLSMKAVLGYGFKLSFCTADGVIVCKKDV